MIALHLLLFCMACMIWTKSKVNYRFIFEYDVRHTLEWRQLLEVRFTYPLVAVLHTEISLGFMFFSFFTRAIDVAQFFPG